MSELVSGDYKLGKRDLTPLLCEEHGAVRFCVRCFEEGGEAEEELWRDGLGSLVVGRVGGQIRTEGMYLVICQTGGV